MSDQLALLPKLVSDAPIAIAALVEGVDGPNTALELGVLVACLRYRLLIVEGAALQTRQREQTCYRILQP